MKHAVLPPRPPAQSADAWLARVAQGGLSAQDLTIAGFALAAEKRVAESIDVFMQALSLKPDFAPAHTGVGGCLALEGLHLEAAESFRTAYMMDPQRLDDLARAAYHRQYVCAWAGLGDDVAELRQRLNGPDTALISQPVDPFAALTLGLGAADQRRAADLYAARAAARSQPPLPRLKRPSWDGRRRLRIGYLSADFYSHATMVLWIGALEAHDRARFEVFLYSHSPDDGSPLRRRTVAAAEHFVEVGALSDRALAQRMQADGIDIFIDLKGYTKNARYGVAPLRPAPVQVNFLGFPGTLGGRAFDYVVADATVAPTADARHFAEALAHMPHGYQPNDDQRRPGSLPARAQVGLPATGFVFACFNQAYKITPTVWALWLRLVQAVPDSTLWLLSCGPQADAALQQRWTHAGLAPARLVLAPKLSLDAHLARLPHADLCLDTVPVNAHTTAADALCAGVPVLTVLGDTFASRVAASLLRTVGLPELVCANLADYETLALRLAHEAEHLAHLKARLLAARETSPLFNSRQFAQGFEALLTRMAQRQAQGLKPAALLA
jgi:protein O-GlcNAc transferase